HLVSHASAQNNARAEHLAGPGFPISGEHFPKMARTDDHPARANPSSIAEYTQQDVQWVALHAPGCH
ncbi:hypothetical protein OAG82_03975, partial [Rubripirellula sp.]